MAITDTDTAAGRNTVWTETGPAKELSGRRFMGSFFFGGAAGSLVPEIFVGNKWLALGPAQTTNTDLTLWTPNRIANFRRFRLRCVLYVSGNITANYKAAT